MKISPLGFLFSTFISRPKRYRFFVGTIICIGIIRTSVFLSLVGIPSEETLRTTLSGAIQSFSQTIANLPSDYMLFVSNTGMVSSHNPVVFSIPFARTGTLLLIDTETNTGNALIVLARDRIYFPTTNTTGEQHMDYSQLPVFSLSGSHSVQKSELTEGIDAIGSLLIQGIADRYDRGLFFLFILYGIVLCMISLLYAGLLMGIVWIIAFVLSMLIYRGERPSSYQFRFVHVFLPFVILFVVGSFVPFPIVHLLGVSLFLGGAFSVRHRQQGEKIFGKEK